MRKIKFRVWSDKSKSWLKDENVLSFYISNDGELEIDCSDWSKSKLTIQQYTGLKDKNGVEIYEGDLCVASLDESYSHLKYEIDYRSGCFWFGNIPLYKQVSIFVVGNIFEGVDK